MNSLDPDLVVMASAQVRDRLIFDQLQGALGFVLMGLVVIALSLRPASRAAWRVRFEKRHVMSVPAVWSRALERRLALLERIGGAGCIGAGTLAALVPFRGAGDPAGLILGQLGAGLLAIQVAMALRLLVCVVPLFPEGPAVARPRAVTMTDYVPPRVRRVVLICVAGAVALLLVSIRMISGNHPGFAAWSTANACMLLITASVVGAAARRLAAAPEPALDEAQLFLQDALRAQGLVESSEGVVMNVLLTTAFVGMIAADRAGATPPGFPAWIIFAPVIVAVVAWMHRSARRWYVTRLWGGEVPEVVRPPATPAEVAS